MEKIKVTLELTPEELASLAGYLAGHQDTALADTAESQEPEAEAKPKKKASAKAKAPTKSDLRALGVLYSKAGRTDDLKEIFKGFGVTKLGEVPEEKYPELEAELQKGLGEDDG